MTVVDGPGRLGELNVELLHEFVVESVRHYGWGGGVSDGNGEFVAAADLVEVMDVFEFWTRKVGFVFGWGAYDVFPKVLCEILVFKNF